MLILSLLVLVVGWCVLWLVARREAQHNFDRWLEAERSSGRLWTCPERTVGGFPLSIVLTCVKPSFADARNAAFRGELGALRAEVKLHFPTSVVIDLTGPLVIQDAGVSAGLTVSWAAAHVDLRGELPGQLDRGDFAAADVQITAAGLAAPIRIDRGDIGLRPLPQNAPGLQDADLTVKAKGVRDADADAAFGSPEPMEVRVAGIVSKLPGQGASLPLLLEAWRDAGGRFDITDLGFNKGSFRADGSGWLQVDDEHRVEGRLDTRFVGLAPVAARFGLPVDAVKIGGFLSSLLGGRTDANAKDRPDLAMPLVARAGHLYLGPVKTGVQLPPLY